MTETPGEESYIRGTCPHCEFAWRARSSAAGRRARCPRCGKVFVAEAVTPEAEAPSVPESATAQPEEIPGYQIEHELGHGGMGMVYRARELSTKRTVALKVMLAGRRATQQHRRRFEREVEIAASLEHPNVARLYASGLHERHYWFAMEYVDGERLDRFVAREKPDVRALLRLFVPVCEAVSHAHQRGVMHRDLKPGNIMVDKHARPHVLDFGLAKLVDSPAEAAADDVTLAGQVAGTPAYMSPEQTQGDPSLVDIRSDVYSLGVVLYRLLTGQSPYGEGEASLAKLFRAINESEPVPPRRLRKEIPDEVNSIVLRALEKDPSRRYQSAGELGRDIRAHLAGEPVTAKQGSGFYMLRKLAVRHRKLAAAVAAVVVLSLGLGAVMSVLFAKTRVELREVVREKEVLRERIVEVQATAPRPQPSTVASSSRPHRPPASQPRAGSTLGAAPPPGAVVLLAGEGGGTASLSEWTNKEWKPLADGGMEITTGAGNNFTRRRFGDCRLHMEFMVPEGTQFPASAGNSGVYLQGRYEIQIARGSLPLMPPSKGQCGAIYGLKAPDANASLPALVWQTYDVTFRAPRFDTQGNKVADARITAFHNGVQIHRDVDLSRGTSGGRGAEAPLGPLMLQDHGCPVRFRNIWLVPIRETPPSSQAQAVGGPAQAPLSPVAFVSRPPALPGLESWTIDTRRHRGWTEEAAFSPDGQWLAITGRGGSARIWDVSTLEVVRVLVGQTGCMSCLTWSPRGDYLVTGSWADGGALVWEAKTGKLADAISTGMGDVRSVAWSPDGSILATAGWPKRLRFWDGRDFQAAGQVSNPREGTHNLAWSPGGTALAAVLDDGGVVLWDKDGKKLREMENGLPEPTPGAWGRGEVKWSADGSLLAAAWPHSIARVWQARTGSTVATFANESTNGFAISWSPRGSVLAAARWSRASLWDAETRSVIAELPSPEAHAWHINSLCWSPDGRILVGAGQQEAIQLWSVPSRQRLAARLGVGGGVFCQAWSTREDILATGGQRCIWLWEPDTGKLLRCFRGYDGPVRKLAWSPDGSTLASVGTVKAGRRSRLELRLWTTASDSPVITVSGAVSSRSLAWSPDGKSLAYLSGTVHVVQASSGDVTRLPGAVLADAKAAAWSSDGTAILSIDDKGACRRWEIATGEAKTTTLSYVDGAKRLTWAPDSNTIAVVDGTGSLRMGDMVDADARLEVRFPHPRSATALAWAAATRRLAAGTTGGSVVVLDGQTGEVLVKLGRHARGCAGLAWAPDGHHLSSISSDGTVLVWDVSQPERRLVLLPIFVDRPEGPVHGVAISSDGHYRCTPGAEKLLVYVTGTPQGQETLTAGEFAKRYAWKNDPSKAGLGQ